MKNNRGFSLLELLIVVAIILIIATIAIPSLLRSRQSAQESSAVAQIRTINTAEVTYLSSNQGSFGDIPSLITQGLLDSRFTFVSVKLHRKRPGPNYTANADPTSTNAGRFTHTTRRRDSLCDVSAAIAHLAIQALCQFTGPVELLTGL